MSGLLIASEGCQWGLYDCYWCSRLKAVYCSCGPGIPSSCFVFAEPISERDNIWCKRTMRLRSHPLSECLSLKRRGLEQACWETGEGIAYGPSYSDTAEWLSLLLTHSRLLSNSLTRTLYLFLSLNAHTRFTETHIAWLNRITGRFERGMERWWRIAKIRLKCYLVLRMREDMEFLNGTKCSVWYLTELSARMEKKQAEKHASVRLLCEKEKLLQIVCHWLTVHNLGWIMFIHLCGVRLWKHLWHCNNEAATRNLKKTMFLP